MSLTKYHLFRVVRVPCYVSFQGPEPNRAHFWALTAVPAGLRRLLARLRRWSAGFWAFLQGSKDKIAWLLKFLVRLLEFSARLLTSLSSTIKLIGFLGRLLSYCAFEASARLCEALRIEPQYGYHILISCSWKWMWILSSFIATYNANSLSSHKTPSTRPQNISKSPHWLLRTVRVSQIPSAYSLANLCWRDHHKKRKTVKCQKQLRCKWQISL